MQVKRCQRFKGFRSLLPKLMCSSPKVGPPVNRERHRELGDLSNKENVPSRCFAASAALCDQEMQTWEQEASAIAPAIQVTHCDMSPITLEPSSHMEVSAVTDGFSEFLGGYEDAAGTNGSISSSMALLLSDPLMSQGTACGSVLRPARRVRKGLFRSPSMPEKLHRPLLKRPERADELETPMRVKRSRSTSSPIREEADIKTQVMQDPLASCGHWVQRTLKKTLSCDMDIQNILEEDMVPSELIGDFSKVRILPTLSGNHQDLQYIGGETMVSLLCGEFNGLIEKYFIVDCRYPYEYDGGHIKGALNLHKEDDICSFFLASPVTASSAEKRIVLVFHCEFSSERAPKMCRFLRRQDRSANDYPALHYPELYVLKGGYKEFFREYKMWCDPQAYCPMHHQDHKEELLKFRSRSKLLTGARRRREQICKMIKM
ncbi:M-phase inducer phosphatase 1-A-like [Polypterus senegalus]|uniref:M-phase inducer phosphatase 1-A-like n=1 Tax=Polypterus senegalus TaxID=55291 RepID=UPI001963054D|nr:M-phase inducer phosphatase 1-A-like [Polypterus senegalus]